MTMNRPLALLRFLLACWRANVQAALEYRTSLLSQGIGMFLSNIMWLVFFAAYFERFRLPGWTRDDVVTLWAIAAGAFGLGGVLFGNAPRIATLVLRGELDFYLALPKPLLLHVLASRMSLVALGDVAFSFITFELTAPTWGGRGVFLLCVLAGATIAISFAVLAGSLAFFLGNAEQAAAQIFQSLIHFSTYPSRIYQGATRLLMHAVVPAAFIAGIPVQILRAPSWELVALEAAGVVAFLTLAVSVFHAGLRRYTSGNLLLLRD
jgi:ABC-2 type transport system permease protein